MTCYLIKNPTIVNEGKVFISDILIKSGKIDQIGFSLSSPKLCKIIDAKGLYLFPGMIDSHVHFREPGFNYKGDLESESKSAVMGGITSYMDMPNCNPQTLSVKLLDEKKKLALKKSHANFAFYLGTNNNNCDQILSLSPNVACGVKIFFCQSTGNMVLDDIKIIEKIFKNSPLLIAVHCEDKDIIDNNSIYFKSKYGNKLSILHHNSIRSSYSCFKSSSFAVSLANKYNSKLHILHLTSTEEVELLKNYRKKNLSDKLITSEACVHHLFFSDLDYATKKNLIKCNPSIKSEYDRLFLINALNTDIIDTISTDHAPHTWYEKKQSYTDAPAGVPVIQYALLSLLEHYHNKMISLETIVNKTSHSPAMIYKVKDRGFIRENYWADLVLINLNRKNLISDSSTKHKCGWSPFNGLSFSSKIEKTFVNGILKYDHNKIVSDKLGCALSFDHDW